MSKILLLILFVTPCIFSEAQVSWQSVPVPNESVISTTVTSSNVAYIGTGTYGVFKSDNDGISWTNISAGLGDSGIAQLQAASDDKIFASTFSHGIYRYSLGSWTAINNGLPANNTTAISIAKGTAGAVYMMASTGKIYAWNGSIWNDITFNFPVQGRGIATGPDGSLYAGAFASGVYKFDGASAWTLVGGVMTNNFITKICITPADTIFVACNSNNVFKCATTGGTWTLANAGLPVANMNFIAADASNRLYVAPNVANGIIYRSSNGGLSWSLISSSLFTTTFNCLTTSPSGKIYAGASGVFNSANAGDNWNDLNKGLPAPKAITCFSSTRNGMLFVGTKFGAWRSSDNGNTWQLKNTGFTHLTPMQIMENAAGNLLCRSINNTPKGAIYRSVDNGDNWTMVAANGTDMYTKIKQHKADTIWATSRFSGATSLSYSINNGATWINNPLSISAIWDIDFSKENTIFLGSESEGVSRSDNGGQSFTLGVGNTIPWYGNVIAIETDALGVIFAGGDWWTHTLWFSSPAENGNNWAQFTDPDLTISGVQDMVFDQQNNVYIAAENGGIRMAYNSTWNAATNWIQSSAGLPSATANMLELGFDNAGFLYSVCYTANGHDGGLFKSTSPVNPPSTATYTFTGNGNWNLASNWSNSILPPASLSGNSIIIVDPPLNGECILNVQQQVSAGATLKIMPGKKLRILSGCNISQ